MIDWLVQTMSDLPALPAEAWLSPPEQERLAALRVEKRRREWLLGRWTAKSLAQTVFARDEGRILELNELSIEPARDGSPRLWLATRQPPLATCYTITISHSCGRAFCALSPAGTAVGADIETIAAHGLAFAGEYFTPDEQALVAAAPAELHDTLVTAIWSAKEAVLKALRLGLTVDTRTVECLVPLPDGRVGPGDWMPFTARCRPALGGPPDGLSCWWRPHDGVVLSLAAAA